MEHICIIAEAGVNHNGNYETAIQMVKAAKKAGADYIKFQTFVPEKLVSESARKAEYQKKTTGSEESQLDMLKKLTLTKGEFLNIKKSCDKVGIGFISTPFDLDSIDFLKNIDMDFWKIPSGEITNLPYLEKLANTKKKIIMSTGMSDINEIKDAVNLLEKNGAEDIVLLHCNTQYPTPFCDVNLKAMDEIKRKTGKKVGYSDHTNGIEIPIAAAAMGAVVIEKHFTLDRNMEGPDHKASLEPDELSKMISSIRNIEKAMGDGMKRPSGSEMKNRDIVRKSIVASKEIKSGEFFSEDNITAKRPGDGISPMHWHEVLGMEAIKDFKKDEKIIL
ncbi:MAG: N-acetylneuraminate synthase [Clostridium sp.]|nr:N-acetylneuraminate synthase [Clostridium sp.]